MKAERSQQDRAPRDNRSTSLPFHLHDQGCSYASSSACSCRAGGWHDGSSKHLQYLLDAIHLDPEQTPVTWAEWDALDTEEKGAVLEDYFRVVAALTGREAGVPGAVRHVV